MFYLSLDTHPRAVFPYMHTRSDALVDAHVHALASRSPLTEINLEDFANEISFNCSL